MGLFYSASVGGFFDDRLQGPDIIPLDAVAISEDRHRELLDAQASGATISADVNGRPRASRPTVEARRAALVRRVKREAADRITRIAPVWRQLNDQRSPSPQADARFASIDAVRAASDAIEAEIATLSATAIDAFALASHPLWPAE